MLQTALSFWNQLIPRQRASFRFIQVSTDEVYGSLSTEGSFTETTGYQPSSPYSASKAGADHLARAWYLTFGLPTVISNCSNNYGPFQNREKLIPTIIRKALSDRPIPIYGDGRNVRDWLYVNDHIEALLAVRANGQPGENYNIGAHNEVSNIDLATSICALLDERRPRPDGRPHADLIEFVATGPVTIFVTRSMLLKPSESSVGNLVKVFKPVCPKLSIGISTIRTGPWMNGFPRTA